MKKTKKPAARKPLELVRVVDQFESFAAAHERLRAPIDDFDRGIRAAIDSGDREASTRLASQLYTSMPPAIVCLAFCLEVGLKALLTKLGRPFGDDHGLHVLARKLPDEVRERLAAPSGLGIGAWQQRLGAAGSSFVQWRYAYESAGLSADHGFLATMVLPLRRELRGTDEPQSMAEVIEFDAMGKGVDDLVAALKRG